MNMKVGLSGGYFNYPLQKQTAYFQSMPEYLLYDGLKSVGMQVNVYGTKSYPFFKGLDVFNCHHISRTMQYLGLIKRYPLVITLHNPFIASGYKPRLNWRTLHTLRNADALVALSQTEKNRLISDYGLDGNRIHVIPNGLKLELYKKPEKLLSRQKYGIPENHRVILTVGQFLPYKNFTLLAQIFKKIARQNSKVTLIIKTLASDSFPSNWNIRVITDRLTQRELTDLYYSCDLYVQPSSAEALCTCITEAMLCERPVVATDVGGTSTQVIHNKTGLLVHPNHWLALHKAINDLLLNTSKAEELGKNAARHAQKFNQKTMVSEYFKLYQMVFH